jgi:hypothetical protein
MKSIVKKNITKNNIMNFLGGIKKSFNVMRENINSYENDHEYNYNYNYNYNYEHNYTDENTYDEFVITHMLSLVESNLSPLDKKLQIIYSSLYTENDEQPTQILTYDSYLEESNEYIFTKLSGDIISCPGKYILTYGDIANSINKKYPTLSNISIVINKDVKNIKNIFDKFDILNFHND